uniref:Uncharacterized protein n=1 Tax=Sphaerodactylus townsendi TaxID=933632 RepID=A0ACB8G1Y5_9SAUR
MEEGPSHRQQDDEQPPTMPGAMPQWGADVLLAGKNLAREEEEADSGNRGSFLGTSHLALSNGRAPGSGLLHHQCLRTKSMEQASIFTRIPGTLWQIPVKSVKWTT